jgi:hypothetical protein
VVALLSSLSYRLISNVEYILIVSSGAMEALDSRHLNSYDTHYRMAYSKQEIPQHYTPTSSSQAWRNLSNAFCPGDWVNYSYYIFEKVYICSLKLSAVILTGSTTSISNLISEHL